jgi:protein FAM50
MGPKNRVLFDYSSDPPPSVGNTSEPQNPEQHNPLSVPATKSELPQKVSNDSTLEGTDDDPTNTKVVDRRWYERNKHIFPASVWQEFDPEKDYQNEVKRDAGGNAFFFS